MPRKQKNKTNKSWFRRHFWHILLLICAIGVVCTPIFWHNKHDDNITCVNLDINPPTIQSFEDTNNTVFTSDTDIPDVNNNRTLGAISPITISYNWESGPYAPTFAINLDKNDLHKYIKISPTIRGNFEIRGTNTIKFTPDAPWPADTKFTIRISKKLFDNDVRPNKYSTTITTPEIAATVDSFNLYHNPQHPQSMIGVAVVSFNYPIDTDHFANKISLKLDGAKLGFDVRFDRFHRTAFIISKPVPVSDAPQNIRLKINRIPALNGNSATKKITANTTIDARDTLFRITDLESIVADDAENHSTQLILIKTSAPAISDLGQHVTAYLLPQYRNDTNTDTNYIWADDEITPDVLKKSKKINLHATKFATPAGTHQYAFAYNIPDIGPRYMYLDITAGAKSSGDFVMKNGIKRVIPVAYPEQTVQIAGTGAVLNMGGDKKLAIMTRGGVQTVYANLSKIKSSEINHLISQTYNVFASDVEFKSWSFGTYDMSNVFQKRIPMNVKSAVETNYASIDLGDYMDRVANDKTGVFIIQVGPSENDADFSDRRLVLVTDMGLIRKVNSDGTSTLFVSRINIGGPASDIEIDVLGRNGNAIWSGRTDANGYVDIPSLPWSEYKNAREPVAIVARDNNDISFIPYNSAYATRVDYSKFNIDGMYSYSDTPLNAFVFTDRGIYRPGESITIGTIVKNNTFKPLAGVPVRVEITDSRGRTVSEKNLSLQSDGLFDMQYDIPATAPIGEYGIRIYSLNVRSKPQDMLGNTTFRVEEFVPDTMKITANIANTSDNGWVSTDAMSATVNLRNLFGTPAQNHRIAARATLRPIQFKFDQYPQYTFDINNVYSESVSQTSPINTKSYTLDIDDIYTNEDGVANIDIKFKDNILYGTYLLTLNINGFELNSGRSVQTTLTARTTDAKYLVGHYANSDLKYINRNAKRTINLIALDHTATPVVADNLTARVIRRDTLTSLVKDYNNYYKYQTTTRDALISETDIKISENGLGIPLNTDTPGTYFLQIIDSDNHILSNIEYFIAGDENTALTTDTNAELSIKLDSDKYRPGQDISVNITAPYNGSGLITIERDRVYAYKWFTAKTTSSTHTITIPSDFEGTGYINVSFVRDIKSRDIFTSPYTYAVAPFSTDISNRTIDIKLSTPDTIRDNKLTIQYQTNKSGRIMLFAINEGILQVARHKTPNPLAYFFQKSALQVETFQILSLLLPEYKILREFAKTGGGDYGDAESMGALSAPLVNPFARRVAMPVAFYSGILNTTANTPEQITFEIPDDFNGALRVFAVAANDTATGAGDTTTLVQSPLVISVTAPTFVAPNDIFDTNAVITNLTNLGDVATIQTDAIVSDNLALDSDATITHQIANDAQQLFIFRTRATDTPAPAEITINAMAVNDNGLPLLNRTLNATMSVRPITPFTVDIQTGLLKSKSTSISDFALDLYPQESNRTLYISTGSEILARPLFEYLKNYEFTCTEQLVSRTIPYALMPHSTILGTDYDTSAKKIQETINILKNRQHSNGSFALWSTNIKNTTPSDTAYLTAYVVNFLTLANDNGFNVPDVMLGRALDFLRDWAGDTITNDNDARALAYVIYTITSNGYVTTAYIDRFQEYANKHIHNWENSISGAYIAASFEMLKQSDMANKLIDKYRMSKSDKFKYESLYENNVANDAMYLYIAKHYFDMPATNIGPAINGYINSGNYDAYTSSRIVMALSGDKNTTNTPDDIAITHPDGTLSIESDNNVLSAQIPSDIDELNITCPSCRDTTLYWAILQSGFTRETKDDSNGIEIVREYFDMSGNRITRAKLGDIINVRITARARSTNHIPNVAILDLLPGGFVAEDISGDATFSEIREDRVIIYTDLTRQERTFTYRAQLTAGGEFAIAPIRAMSLYNASVFGTDVPATKTFSVLNASNE